MRQRRLPVPERHDQLQRNLPAPTANPNCGACGHDCSPGACSSGKCGRWTLASGATVGLPVAIASDEVHFAWLDAQFLTAVEVPVSGSGGATTLAQNVSSAGGYGGIAIGGGLVVWTIQANSGTELWSANDGLGGSGGIQITQGGTDQAWGLALSGTTVYIGTGNGTARSLLSCTFGATSCSTLYSFTDSGSGNELGLNGDRLFWTASGAGAIGRMSVSGGSSTAVQLATGQAGTQHLALDNLKVYWSTNSSAGFTMAGLSQVSAPGTTPQTILQATQGGLNELATDGTNAYFAGGFSASTGVRGQIGYVPVNGSNTTAAVLSISQTALDASRVVAVGGVVYWVAGNLTSSNLTYAIYGQRFP